MYSSFFQVWVWLSSPQSVGQLRLLWLLQSTGWKTRWDGYTKLFDLSLKQFYEMILHVSLFIKMGSSGVCQTHGEQISTMREHSSRNIQGATMQKTSGESQYSTSVQGFLYVYLHYVIFTFNLCPRLRGSHHLNPSNVYLKHDKKPVEVATMWQGQGLWKMELWSVLTVKPE